MHNISEEEIVRYFKGGIDCSQVVFMQWAEELGYDKEEGARMMAAFGGGTFRGDTCGAVSGAMMVIGLKYGHYQIGDRETKAKLMAKVAEFQKKFTERCDSTICRELCGYDFSKEGDLDKAFASGKLFELCPKFVINALAVLDEII